MKILPLFLCGLLLGGLGGCCQFKCAGENLKMYYESAIHRKTTPPGYEYKP